MSSFASADRGVPATSSSRLRVGVIDEYLPYPPNAGKPLRTLNLLIRAAEHHDITVVCPRNEDPDNARDAERYFMDRGIKVHWVPRYIPPNQGLRFYLRLATNLFSRLPYTVQRHQNDAMRYATEKLEQQDAIDLWHVEWTPYANNLSTTSHRPLIVTAHNIETLIWDRYYEHEPNPVKAWYIAQQCRKLRRFERNVFHRAGMVITVSNDDAALASSEFGANSIAVIPNGVDPAYFHVGKIDRDPLEILFLGSLFWRPNVDAVQMLLNSVFPRVVAIEPKARLTIVGHSPPPSLQRQVSRFPWASLHASVPDARPYIWRCGAMIVPLRIGGGTRLKILEALSCNCPVISTSVGAEGIDVSAGTHYVAADTSEAMAQAIVDSINDPTPIRQMTQLGRTAVLRKYNWDMLASELANTWRRFYNQSVS